ncbi:DUF6882 domain-containing protein [Homoserinibacter sp. YIM 151385]|uniref:DUF6882 domain-containing protein n=1 Tax=Homoserinibacter sp. YIM 151385 TaxID=2985506 RepID=UPI0022F06491|nr:DUF6882 domain-containing protein [Homoserinibacter sp. YIM 151385]WBU37996.1 hypothetical protein OF852_13940 [Homoserinibacter sp. YIM 151385]
MTESQLFTKLVDVGALLAHEHQVHLQERITEHTFQFDMTAGSIAFQGPAPFAARMQILGSAASEPGTWLWSWANPASQIPVQLTATSRMLQQYGQQHEVPEFAEQELPLGEDTWQRLAVASVMAAREPRTTFPAPAGNGTIVLTTLDSPELELPRPSVTRTVRIISEAFATIRIESHAAAVARYALDRGLEFDWRDGAPRITLPDGHIDLEIDPDQDRITKLSASGG